MKFEVIYNGEKEKKPLKEIFGATVSKIGENPDFIYLDADLMSSIGTKSWAEKNPNQAFNVGIAEANMMGVAAGLAASGFKPLVHTFGPFASRRSFDQAFLSIGYAKNDVVIVGSDPGVTAAFNGGTHMPFEDMALYRAVPGATVIDITDSVMLADLLPKLIEIPGLKYVRMGRKEAVAVYAEGSTFETGKAAIVRDGQDLTICASGIMVAEALAAARQLADEGIDAAVLDMFSVKPIDEKAILDFASRTGAFVTAENHNIINGLGSAVADVLARSLPCPLEMVGVNDEFGQVGPQDYLQQYYGLTSDKIIEKARAVLARKK